MKYTIRKDILVIILSIFTSVIYQGLTRISLIRLLMVMFAKPELSEFVQDNYLQLARWCNMGSCLAASFDERGSVSPLRGVFRKHPVRLHRHDGPWHSTRWRFLVRQAITPVRTGSGCEAPALPHEIPFLARIRIHAHH